MSGRATPTVEVRAHGRRFVRPVEGNRRRTQRANARGEVWCYDCERFLPPGSFRPVVNRGAPGLASYCRDCARARNTATEKRRHLDDDLWARRLARERERSRAKTVAARAERRRLADLALSLVDRGLVASDLALARRLGVAAKVPYSWRRHPDRAPETRACRRIVALVAELAS